MDRMLKPEEVAEKLNISRPTLYKWVQKGKIPAYKYGRGLRFSEEEIEQWVKQHPKHPEMILEKEE